MHVRFDPRAVSLIPVKYVPEKRGDNRLWLKPYPPSFIASIRDDITIYIDYIMGELPYDIKYIRCGTEGHRRGDSHACIDKVRFVNFPRLAASNWIIDKHQGINAEGN